MTASLPKTLAFRAEHTGTAGGDRAQRQAQQVTKAHEQTKAIVAALMNSAYTALTVNTTIGVAAYAALLSTTITTVLASGHLDITFNVSGANSTATANARFQVLVDGVAAAGTYAFTTAGNGFGGSIVVRVAVTRGAHTVAVQWKSDAGAARINAASVAEEGARLLVQEAL